MEKKTSKPVEADNDDKANINNDAIVREKTYSIKWVEYANGKCAMTRKCGGFNAFELLGIITLTQQDIIDQIKGKIKPDFIKREVVI